MALIEVMNLLHSIGIAGGVGGATVAAVLMIKSEKDPELGSSMMKVMPAISKLIWAAIVLLIISGIILTQLVTWPIDQTILTLKHVVVVLLILNGIYMTLGIQPKMQKLAPKGGAPSGDFLKAKKHSKISGALGLVLWYVILVLSVIM